MRLHCHTVHVVPAKFLKHSFGTCITNQYKNHHPTFLVTFFLWDVVPCSPGLCNYMYMCPVQDILHMHPVRKACNCWIMFICPVSELSSRQCFFFFSVILTVYIIVICGVMSPCHLQYVYTHVFLSNTYILMRSFTETWPGFTNIVLMLYNYALGTSLCLGLLYCVLNIV